MMSIEILGAEKLKAKLNLITKPHPAIVQAMHDIVDTLARKVKEDKLSGQVLNRVTGRLSRSITGRVETLGNEIDGVVGTNVEYAKIHEYGGIIHIPPKSSLIRHRLTAKGDMMKQKTNKNLLRFAKNSHKQAIERWAEVKGHDIKMPERSFMRTSLAETKAYAKERLITALEVATQ